MTTANESEGGDAAASRVTTEDPDTANCARTPTVKPIHARRLAAALRSCPHIRRLHTGPLGTITTASPSGPIDGILVSPAMILIGLMVREDTDREHLARRIRARVNRLAPNVPVTLSIITDAAHP